MHPVTLASEEGIAVVRMDDGKANALNPTFLDAFNRVLDEAEGVKAPIALLGRSGFFSGGLDLRTLPGMPAPELRSALEQFGNTMMRLFAYPYPLVAGCTGHMLAGGTVMALCADTRIGPADLPAKIGLNETQIGLSLPRFVIELVQSQCSPQAWRPIMLEGQIFDPAGAQAVGLLDRTVPGADVPAETIAQAKKLAALPRDIYAETKTRIRAAFLRRGQDAYPAELDMFLEMFSAVAGR